KPVRQRSCHLPPDRKIVSKQPDPVHEKTRIDKKTVKEVTRVLKFSVTVSKWFMNSWLGYEVVTLDRRYFSLTSPVKRRMYEVARKYCGKDKAVWKIDLANLSKKLGYKNPIIKLREDIREMMVEGLFEYRIALEAGSPGFAVVYTTDQAALHKWIMATKNYDWWQALEKEPKRRKRAAAVEVLSAPDIEDTATGS
ncbi:MAG: replication initiator protein A, partial [Burkholderia sp.]